MYVSNLLVDVFCTNGKTTRFLGPSMEVTVQDEAQIAEEPTSRRRLQTVFENITRIWTNSMRYDSLPVANLFDKNYTTYWEVANNGNANDVCIEFAQCTEITSFWLYIPKSELPSVNTKLGDVKVSM
jgi:hypothetical protein